MFAYASYEVGFFRTVFVFVVHYVYYRFYYMEERKCEYDCQNDYCYVFNDHCLPPFHFWVYSKVGFYFRYVKFFKLFLSKCLIILLKGVFSLYFWLSQVDDFGFGIGGGVELECGGGYFGG